MPHPPLAWPRPARCAPPPTSLSGSAPRPAPSSGSSQPSPSQALASPALGGQLNWMFLLSTQGPLWDTPQGDAGRWPSFTSLPTSLSPSLDLPLALPQRPEADPGHFEQTSARLGHRTSYRKPQLVWGQGQQAGALGAVEGVADRTGKASNL